MWDLGFLINETPIALGGRMVYIVHALVLCGIWVLFINEAPNALRGRMVCTVKAPLLCGIWACLSMKHQLP